MSKDISVLWIEIAVFIVAVIGVLMYLLLSIAQIGHEEAMSNCLESGYSKERCESILY